MYLRDACCVSLNSLTFWEIHVVGKSNCRYYSTHLVLQLATLTKMKNNNKIKQLTGQRINEIKCEGVHTFHPIVMV